MVPPRFSYDLPRKTTVLLGSMMFFPLFFTEKKRFEAILQAAQTARRTLHFAAELLSACDLLGSGVSIEGERGGG